MNIKKVMVQVAMAIQEKDADVYNMVVRGKEDKTKPSSIMLNGVSTLSFVEAEEVPTYIVKFMGKGVHTDWSLTGAIDTAVRYAQEYADNREFYNKVMNIG